MMPKPPWKRRPEILRCPNTPKPMHGVAPRQILGQSWWNKTRKAAYASTNNHCIACGVHKLKAKHRQWVEGHEVYLVDYLLGYWEYLETVPLCHFCHNYIHGGRLKILLDKGKISATKYTMIRQHGDSVLANANLSPKAEYPGPFAEWKDWRMILNGTEYPSLFLSEDEWAIHYRRC